MNNESPWRNDLATSTESVLQSQWPIPLWAMLVFAILAITFAAWIYWTERGSAAKWIRALLATIRCLLLLLVLWMLGGWSFSRFKTELPELAIVVDISASMATEDEVAGDQKQSRLDAVKSAVTRAGKSSQLDLSERYQVRWYTLADALQSSPGLFSPSAWESVAANGSQTELGSGLSQLVDRQVGRGAAAIVLLSDGINTSGPGLEEAEKRARTAAIPIYAAMVGRPVAMPDIRLADLMIDREVYFGDRVAAEVSVIASDVAAAKVRMSLRDVRSGNVLDETEVEFAGGENQKTTRLSFVPEKPGEIELRISASAIEGETELANNALNQTVNVQDKLIRVLLVHGRPSYEFRFLKHLLERTQQVGDTSAASFELESVLQQSDPEYVEQDESAIRLVPSGLERIDQFDAFIFGEFDPGLVSRRSQQAIYEAVTEKGAGCIFVYGTGRPARELEGWPLGELLPVQFPDAAMATVPVQRLFQWRTTSLGATALPMQLGATPAESVALWRRLPGGVTVAEVGVPKTGAQVMATGVSAEWEVPLLVTQYAGAGRVALQATDETYRWTNFEGSDIYHQRYWGQMLRWLSRGKLNVNAESSALVVEPRQAKFGQPIWFEARIGSELRESQLPDNVEITLEMNGQVLPPMSLSGAPGDSRVYSGSTAQLAPGSYRAILSRPASETPPSQTFTVTSPPGEQANLRANVEGMRSLAERSRGRFYESSRFEELFKELPDGQPTRLGTLPPNPIWNSPWIALLFIGLIAAEWIIRRTVRML